MRFLAILLMVVPTFGMADEIVLSGAVTDVTVYPDGASVTRNIAFSAPAGRHELIIADLPLDALEGLPRISVEGARMGVVRMRSDYVPPRDEIPSAELAAARDAVEAIETEIRGVKDAVAEARLLGDAAAARIGFLRQIGEGDKLANTDLTLLRDLSRMIGEETLAARQAEHRAAVAARAVEDTLGDLRDNLEVAKKRLVALVPQDRERAYISVAVSSDTAMDGVLTIRHFAQAGWIPTYDFRLRTGDAPRLTIDRGAMVVQNTGENWGGVNLTLSTVRPTLQTEPSRVFARGLRIEDPAPPVPMQRSMAADAMVMPMVEMVESAVADYNGLSVTYLYPAPINIASGADKVRIALGQLGTSATTFAKAVPLYDETAFLVAEFTNDMNEIILPSQEVSFYLDGQFVGKQVLDGLIPVGGEAALAFGPIEGLRLSRKIMNRVEGDRGFVNRSNAKTERVRIEVENLTDRAWDVRMVDGVPYSEQKDLEITWGARPMPDVVDLDGRRGILQWEFLIEPLTVKAIELSHEIEWPDGKVLR